MLGVSILFLFLRFLGWVLELLRQSGIFIMPFIKSYTYEGTNNPFSPCVYHQLILVRSPLTLTT